MPSITTVPVDTRRSWTVLDHSCPDCGAKPRSPCTRVTADDSGQRPILSRPHQERYRACGVPDDRNVKAKVRDLLCVDLVGWWDASTLTSRLGFPEEERRRVQGALVSLRNDGAVTSRKPTNGKGRYGITTLEWSRRGAGEPDAD